MESSTPSGWRVRSIPAHCHPSLAGGALSGTKTREPPCRLPGNRCFPSPSAFLPLKFRPLELRSLKIKVMDVFEITRALIDIESITNNEERVGNYLYDYLAPLAARFDGHLERIEVEPRRFNLFAQWGEALTVTLSTHMDTVPPYIASPEGGQSLR